MHTYVCITTTVVQRIFKEKIIFTKILSRLSAFVLLTNFTCLFTPYSIKIILCFNQFTSLHKYLCNYHQIIFIIIILVKNIYLNL